MKSLLLSAALLVGLLGISAASATAANTVVVHITNGVFSPNSITISKGETVEWINNDEAKHVLIAIGGAFESPHLLKGQSFRYIFHRDGRFVYYCGLSRTMGRVVVK